MVPADEITNLCGKEVGSVGFDTSDDLSNRDRCEQSFFVGRTDCGL